MQWSQKWRPDHQINKTGWLKIRGCDDGQTKSEYFREIMVPMTRSVFVLVVSAF